MGHDIGSQLISGGLTNHYSGDHWEMATSKVGNPYNHYCSNQTCCRIKTGEKESLNKKTGILELQPIYRFKEQVLKFQSYTPKTKCPDCGHYLIVEKSKSKAIGAEL